MLNWLKKYVEPWIPLYSILPLAVCSILNSLVYYGTMFFSRYGTIFHNFTTSFDEFIPVLPISIFIYGSCYVFWALNYILIAHIGKRALFELCSADIIAKIVCLAFFIFLPTTNIRPELLNESLSSDLLRFVYTMDKPVNLLPSIHCLTSWFCFIGMRGKSVIPRWYRIFSLIFAVSICLSTLLTKQHVIIDVVIGVGLAELTFFISRHTKLPLLFSRIFRIDLENGTSI